MCYCLSRYSEEEIGYILDFMDIDCLRGKVSDFIKDLGQPYIGQKIRLSDLEAKGTILYDHYIDYGIGSKVILTDDKAWLLYNNNSHFPKRSEDN